MKRLFIFLLFLSLVVKAQPQKIDFEQMMHLIKTQSEKFNLEIKDEEGKTALHYFVGKGDIKNIKILVEKGADLGAKDASGQTPLHVAVIKGKKEVLRLLTNSDTIQAQDHKGRTPLHLAAQEDHLGVIQFLLSSGSIKIVRDNFASTPLHEASRWSHQKVIELVFHVELIDAKNKWGETPLHLVAKSGNLENLNTLLDLGADPWLKNNEGQTPLDLVRNDLKDSSFIKVLEQAMFPEKEIEQKEKGFFSALKSFFFTTKPKQKEKILSEQNFLEFGSPLGNTEDFEEEILTPLPENNMPEKVIEMIQSGVSTETLLQEKVNLDVQNRHGETPLHLSVKKRDKESIKKLVASGASPEAVNNLGNTPLHEASFLGYDEILNLLITKKNVNVRNFQGDTALHLAVQNDNKKAVKILIKEGADPLIIDKKGQSSSSYIKDKDLIHFINQNSIQKKCVESIQVEKKT